MPDDVKEQVLDIMKRGATNRPVTKKEIRYCDKMSDKYDATGLDRIIAKYKLDYVWGQARD